MRRFLLVTILGFTGLLASGQALATPDDSTLHAQRERFRNLYVQAQGGGWPGIRQSARALEGYPLYPYLEAADLEYRLRRGNVQDARLAALFTQYPDLGAAANLRNRWLKDLARRGEWRQVAEFYQPSDDSELRCLHARANVRLGRGDAALAEAKQLWLSPESLPAACDPLFEWLQDRGQLDADLVQTRIRLAMAAGEARLVRALAKRLSGRAKRNAELWLEIRKDPFDELEELIDDPEPGISAEVIVLGLRLAARNDPLRATQLYEGLARHYLRTQDERDQALGYLGLELALDRQPEALDWYSRLARNPADTDAREWRLRTAIYHSAWDKARAWIEQLPDEERGEQRWRYWLARSHEGLPGEAHAQQARALYAALAVERGYYPYLAADRIGRSYALRHQPVPADPALRSRLALQPAALRAREFHALGFLPQARNEWRGFTAGQSPLELRQSAIIAQSWGWHPQAIMTLARSEYWDDLHLRYPLLYKDEALGAARKAAVDSGWVYGIMRAESLFIPDARSHANAIGLMQLLPSTARQVARDIGLTYHGERTLLEPAANLRLGAEYLRQMRDRFSGNMAMATAAYNAGPHRVQGWRPHARLPADVWVENIPFDETRTYVQRVMEHAVAFDWRLGREITPLSRRMPPVPPAP
ncbi:MAG TPA: transglycosylase SLT domain-containing protein [Nevskiales bacterium]|nr:transglycosylase SLT domain-containing protein [Nevskiales bacterium]